MKRKLRRHNGTKQPRQHNKRPDYHLLQGLTLLLSNSPLFALTCPSPIVVVNSSCEVADSTLTVSPGNAIGLNASGTLGEIIANNIVENLGAANTTGALAQAGAHIVFNKSILKTTATTAANAAGESGLKATGNGSTITVNDSSVTLGPANGTTAASNLSGARAENGGKLNFNNSDITMLGGAAGLNNIGMIATGLGSQISMQGGIVSTIARASYGAFAQAGGIIKLTDSKISTTGSGTATIAGSHALYAQGNNSQIEGKNLKLSTSGLFTNTVRAADGGLIFLEGSIITSSGTSSADTDPASAVRALSGGKIQLQDSTVTATGMRGNRFSVQDAGSSVTLNNSEISVSGTRAKAGYIFDGGLATIIKSSLHSENTDALVVQGLGSHVDLTDSSIRSSRLTRGTC